MARCWSRPARLDRTLARYRQQPHVQEAQVARALDLDGVARASPLLHGPPATEADRLLGLIGGGVSRHPGRDRLGPGGSELGVLGQHLQHRPVQPDPPDLGPQGPVQVGRGPTAPVVAAPLQGGVATKGMPNPPSRSRSRRPASSPAASAGSCSSWSATEARSAAL
jgi:hypothetical protein